MIHDAHGAATLRTMSDVELEALIESAVREQRRREQVALRAVGATYDRPSESD